MTCQHSFLSYSGVFEQHTAAGVAACVSSQSEAVISESLLNALMQVRAQVNALGQAFHKRSNERLISTSAHRLASGTFALHEALARGQPYLQEVEALAMGCEDDPLVIVALQSVPEAYAERVGSLSLI